MDVSTRKWWIRYKDQEEGPIPEEQFQARLRAGQIPLRALIKSNLMGDWKPLLEVVSQDGTFRRPSSMPAPEPAAPNKNR